jgi:16S rRNA pseudouridine516 synthase
MRIDKLLSNLKYGSRHDIKTFISQVEIKVGNKHIQETSFNVDPSIDDIFIDGEKLFYKEEIHLIFYKPKGFLSAHHDQMHPCLIDLIKTPYHRFDFVMAGRLDLDAEGLMILTTSGSLVHEITHPRYHLKKVYEVVLEREFTHSEDLLSGVEIKDGKNNPYLAKALSLDVELNHVKLSIDEGKFHQVKRMFAALDYEVLNLKRIQIGNLTLGDLKPGEYIEFRKEELI